MLRASGGNLKHIPYFSTRIGDATIGQIWRPNTGRVVHVPAQRTTLGRQQVSILNANWLASLFILSVSNLRRCVGVGVLPVTWLSLRKWWNDCLYCPSTELMNVDNREISASRSCVGCVQTNMGTSSWYTVTTESPRQLFYRSNHRQPQSRKPKETSENRQRTCSDQFSVFFH